MLRIFSRERFKAFASGKSYQYLLHASGELLLVIVGILTEHCWRLPAEKPARIRTDVPYFADL